MQAVIAVPIVTWSDWKGITPGIIAITAAVCLFIITNSEEKTIRTIDWPTLLFIAVYRYTTQVMYTCFKSCVKIEKKTSI